MKGCCVKNIATFLWMFWKAFNGKTQRKWKDSLQLIWPLKYGTFSSSDFHRLKTLLATRLVFNLFWRWQPVAHALFQQPRNAAVLKHSQPRTAHTAIWASLIVVAGPYFLALLSGARHLVSCCVAQQLDSKLLCGFASWPFSGSIYIYIYIYICITARIFDSLNCWCIKG